MSGERTAEALMYALMLLLPLSALFSRRIRAVSVLKMALAWVLIFGVGLVLVGQREQLGGLFDGARRTLTGDDQSVVGDTVRIAMAPDGHFWARVSLNGVERRMLVDSGATVTALSERTAKAAGVAYGGAFATPIGTANGTVMAERGRIERLRLGAIEARDLPVVVSAAFGETDVLGMNFLSRLGAWRVEERTLVLDPQKQ